MTRNDMKKQTLENKWHKRYTKHGCLRQHKRNKKENQKKFRKLGKKVIDKFLNECYNEL